MPKNKVSDPITDQEIAFAHLILSGAMTDRQAAETAGLNPDSAAYTKSKPRVRAYMIEHRVAVEQQLVQQEADLSRLPQRAAGRAVDGLHSLNLDREKVLNRLWELATLSPQITRNSITGQLKALSIIVAMLDLIPDRRAVSSENRSAPAPARAQIYEAEWLRKQKAANHATTDEEQPAPAPVPQEEASAVVDQPDFAPEPVSEPVPEPTPDPVPTQPAFAHRVPFADGLSPYVPQSPFVPDTRVPFSIKKNPFKHRR
jgi:hypothetical protein